MNFNNKTILNLICLKSFVLYMFKSLFLYLFKIFSFIINFMEIKIVLSIFNLSYKTIIFSKKKLRILMIM